MKTIKIGEKEFETHGDANDSVSGKNRLLHFCEFFGKQRRYSCCAGLVDAFNEDRLRLERGEDGNLSRTSCAFAMKTGRCVSMKKRQLEIEANAAIFFEDESSKQQIDDRPVVRNDSYWRGWNAVGSSLGKASVEQKDK